MHDIVAPVQQSARALRLRVWRYTKMAEMVEITRLTNDIEVKLIVVAAAGANSM